MADSCQCMAKTTTILYSNWPPIKISKLFKKKKIQRVNSQDQKVILANLVEPTNAMIVPVSNQMVSVLG